jgi:hypothetical protein
MVKCVIRFRIRPSYSVYGVRGFPLCFAIDKHGVVVDQGELDDVLRTAKNFVDE